MEQGASVLGANSLPIESGLFVPRRNLRDEGPLNEIPLAKKNHRQQNLMIDEIF